MHIFSSIKYTSLVFVPTLQKAIATVSRCEGVYNRADELSVTFYEKGAAEHMKNDHFQSGHFDCSVVYCDVVEATGFEPAAPWSQTRCATKLRHASEYLICQLFYYTHNSCFCQENIGRDFLPPAKF